MIYTVIRYISIFIVYLFHRPQFYGLERIPATGGVVIAANHISRWDPFVLGAACKRRIYFMAGAELFDQSLIGAFLTLMGAFPVDRHRANAQAAKHAYSLLCKGLVLGVFPEGARRRTISRPRLGIFFLAAWAQVPILPVAISGTSGVCGKARVFVGETMSPPSRQAKRKQLEEYAERWVKTLNRLLDSTRSI